MLIGETEPGDVIDVAPYGPVTVDAAEDAGGWDRFWSSPLVRLFWHASPLEGVLTLAAGMEVRACMRGRDMWPMGYEPWTAVCAALGNPGGAEVDDAPAMAARITEE